MSGSGGVPRQPVPSTARLYDYYLGGKDNYATDREAADEILAVAPSIRQAAIDNREFLVRVVRYCADAGIEQFVDIGTGIPTPPNVIEVAQEIQPSAVMVGVDNDPIVLSHDNALLPGAHIVKGDVRHPWDIVKNPELNEHIDWRKPVAVLFVAILHFVTDAEDPLGIVATFRDRMVPVSLVVISHVCSTDAAPQEVTTVERIYRRATSLGVFRPRERIQALFQGFELVQPGLVDVQHWPAADGTPTAIPVLGGVARKLSGRTKSPRPPRRREV